MLLVIPVVNASYYTEVKEVALDITQGLNQSESLITIDNYLFNHNNYTFSYRRKNLRTYWINGVGDCTEIARLKYIMYKNIGVKTRIIHGCVMIPKVSAQNNTYGYKCDKHDYVEYYNKQTKTWNTTEQKYFKYSIVKKGRGIW